MSESPNPTETLVACVKCTKGFTFQKDAVCSACRKQDKPATGRKPETVAR